MMLPIPQESSFESRWLGPHPQRNIQHSRRSARLSPIEQNENTQIIAGYKVGEELCFSRAGALAKSGFMVSAWLWFLWFTLHQPAQERLLLRGLVSWLHWSLHVLKASSSCWYHTTFFINQGICFSGDTWGAWGQKEPCYVNTVSLTPKTFPICRQWSILPTSKAWTPTKPLKIKHHFHIFPLQKWNAV